MPLLGVNVDHVATLRQARRVDYPDPLEAALAAERAGAAAITVHLREDRRHIQDHDLIRLRERMKIHLNQELAPVAGMVELALRLRPDEACLVPERREEITTEGGLDVAGLRERLQPIVTRMRRAGLRVSLFIDPEPRQIEAAAAIGADYVELHTGAYANLADRGLCAGALVGKLQLDGPTRVELRKIQEAVRLARTRGVKVNAGHGLNYRNVAPIAAIPGIEWLHIGHAIVARAIQVGMERAVREMLALAKPTKISGPSVRAAARGVSRHAVAKRR